MASSGKKINDWKTEKNVEEICRGLLQDTIRHSPEGTETNHKNLSQCSRCLNQVSMRTPEDR
jgi:hypothetical protein